MTLPELNPYLLIGGLLSFVAAGLHIACIVGGADWLRFFGAGEGLARMAERGHWYPGLVTGFIAVALMVLGTYALVGAAGGAQALPLPFVKWILLAITAVFLLRGGLPFPAALVNPALMTPFILWSSLIVLALGVFHAVGLYQVWGRL